MGNPKRNGLLCISTREVHFWMGCTWLTRKNVFKLDDVLKGGMELWHSEFRKVQISSADWIEVAVVKKGTHLPKRRAWSRVPRQGGHRGGSCGEDCGSVGGKNCGGVCLPPKIEIFWNKLVDFFPIKECTFWIRKGHILCGFWLFFLQWTGAE